MELERGSDSTLLGLLIRFWQMGLRVPSALLSGTLRQAPGHVFFFEAVIWLRTVAHAAFFFDWARLPQERVLPGHAGGPRDAPVNCCQGLDELQSPSAPRSRSTEMVDQLIDGWAVAESSEIDALDATTLVRTSRWAVDSRASGSLGCSRNCCWKVPLAGRISCHRRNARRIACNDTLS